MNSCEIQEGSEGLREIPGEFEDSTRALVSSHLNIVINISLALTYEVRTLAY